jgi:hypothetical protein
MRLTKVRAGQPARMDAVSLGYGLGTPSFARRPVCASPPLMTCF